MFSTNGGRAGPQGWSAEEDDRKGWQEGKVREKLYGGQERLEVGGERMEERSEEIEAKTKN